MVMIMRKNLVIAAAIMIFIGLLIFAGPYVQQTEETSSSAKSSNDPMDHAYEMAKVTERFIAEGRGGGRPDDKSVAMLVGGALIAGGVLFLAKSKDENFLPGI